MWKLEVGAFFHQDDFGLSVVALSCSRSFEDTDTNVLPSMPREHAQERDLSSRNHESTDTNAQTCAERRTKPVSTCVTPGSRTTSPFGNLVQQSLCPIHGTQNGRTNRYIAGLALDLPLLVHDVLRELAWVA